MSVLQVVLLVAATLTVVNAGVLAALVVHYRRERGAAASVEVTTESSRVHLRVDGRDFALATQAALDMSRRLQ